MEDKKILGLNKKEKKAMVQIDERRSVNSDGKGRGKIPCTLTMIGYIPDSLKDEEDKELDENVGGTPRLVWDTKEVKDE